MSFNVFFCWFKCSLSALCWCIYHILCVSCIFKQDSYANVKQGVCADLSQQQKKEHGDVSRPLNFPELGASVHSAIKACRSVMWMGSWVWCCGIVTKFFKRREVLKVFLSKLRNNFLPWWSRRLPWWERWRATAPCRWRGRWRCRGRADWRATPGNYSPASPRTSRTCRLR